MILGERAYGRLSEPTLTLLYTIRLVRLTPKTPCSNEQTFTGLLTAALFEPFYADFRTPPGFLEVFTQPASTGFSVLPIGFAAAIGRHRLRDPR